MEIKQISELIKTQDNRITDQPMFIVQEQVTTGPFEDGYGDYYEWYDHDELELASDHMTMRLDQRVKAGAYSDYKSFRKHSMKDEWKFVTACFTEQGCLNYLELNGHNLGKTRIYAQGSVRNIEYQTVRNMLIEQTAAKAT